VKITRDAFLYLDPKPPEDEFAQCGTCIMFIPDHDRCMIHGAKIKVDEDDSCGLYVHGVPRNGPPTAAVTPKESGLVGRQVRCENCEHFNGKDLCLLFKNLNRVLPDKFDLDTKVSPKGCCNAQIPKSNVLIQAREAP
jgi:hypothetical protein